jgi:hypothetical protein
MIAVLRYAVLRTDQPRILYISCSEILLPSKLIRSHGISVTIVTGLQAGQSGDRVSVPGRNTELLVSQLVKEKL